MIAFEEFQLENGLRVIVHPDHSTPMAVINIIYDVGARDEDPERTGFAHLFEHLMFGGSLNIPSYDAPLQKAGGQNNAFTTNDITNYYLSLPANNLETGFWLESDRMLQLAFTPESLEVQRQVVIEEFKQRYLNQPYGDAWMLLRNLAFTQHPYRWATIGKEISHIEKATLQDVKDFFFAHYRPANAVMVVAGNVEVDKVKELTYKWFGDIPKGQIQQRNLPREPKQTELRRLRVERAVPYDALYMVWHMDGRTSQDYIMGDLLSDLLSRGASSRFNERLIKEKELFAEVSAYITGEKDPGLFVVSGKLKAGVSIEEAQRAVKAELEELKQTLIGERELDKLKNKIESSKRFAEINVLNKAMSLAYHALLGDANGVNDEILKYLSVQAGALQNFARQTFRDENCSVLEYMAEQPQEM